MATRREPMTRPLGRRRLLSGIGGALAIGGAMGWARRADAAPPDGVQTFAADVALDWYDLILDLTRSTPGFSPPVASRAFAYVGVALYEALRPGMADYATLAGVLPGLTAMPGPNDSAYHWGLVANACLARIAATLYSTSSAANLTAITALETSYRSAFAAGVPQGRVNRSVERGQNIAQHIATWASTDGAHQAQLANFPSYTPPVGPGLWVPTPNAFQNALQPFWGSKRSFTMATNDVHDPGPHTPFSISPSSQFHAEAEEVRRAAPVAGSDEDIIARFWSDDPGVTSTPPGHSISIASQVIEQEGVPLDIAVETYLKVGIAVADAFISCWHCKFKYNLLRPITYIRAHIDSTWTPSLSTPPFPEYTSGHSVQSGAMAEVLTDLFGDLAFVDHTHDDRGFAPRSFTSFRAAAAEAAISRLYGGIHFRPAIDIGIDQGIEVGKLVNALPI